MANNYTDVLGYYKNWMNRMYSGKEYLSPGEMGLFKDMEALIETQRKRGIGVEMEIGARTGMTGSTVWEKNLTERVTEPIEKAHAALGLEKLGIIQTEKQRRHKEAMGMSLQKIEEERQKKKGLWGTLGKLAGTIGGGIIGLAGGPMGVLTGASIGAGLGGGLFGGGGGGAGGYNWDNIWALIEQWEEEETENNGEV